MARSLFGELIDCFEHYLLYEGLRTHDGSRAAVGRAFELSDGAVYRKIGRYGLHAVDALHPPFSEEHPKEWERIQAALAGF